MSARQHVGAAHVGAALVAALLVGAYPKPAAAQWIELPGSSVPAVFAGTLEYRSDSVGVPLRPTVSAALNGDSAAVVAMLRLSARLAGANETGLPLLLAGILESIGDEPFSRALRSLPVDEAGAAWQAQVLLTSRTVNPITAALGDSLPKAPDPDTALTRQTVSADQRPRMHPGSCFPEYPSRLRNSGHNGRVLLAYVVGANGRVDPRSVLVLAANHPDFATAAIRMLNSCEYQPATLGGRPARVRTQQVITFTRRP